MYRMTNVSRCCLIYFFILLFTVVKSQNCTENGSKAMIDPTSCCMIPKGIKTEVNPNLDKCFGNENSTQCEIAKCIFKEQKFLTVNGTLNMDEISKEILDGKPQEWRGPAKESLKTCSSKVVGKPCAEVLFADCLFYTMFLNCPSMFWHESEKCQATKEYVQKCLLVA